MKRTRNRKKKEGPIAADPEKVKEVLRDEEEAMAEVFKNEPFEEIRNGQGSRSEDPRSKVETKIG